MTSFDLKILSTRPIHIGQIIEKECKKQNKSISWLANQINCDRRNVYDIFSRESLNTHLLYKISRVLGCDFFALYSEALSKCCDGLTIERKSDHIQTVI